MYYELSDGGDEDRSVSGGLFQAKKTDFKSVKNLSWDNVTLFLQDSKGIRSIDNDLNGFSSDTGGKWTRNYLFEFTFGIFNNPRIFYAQDKLLISVQNFENFLRAATVEKVVAVVVDAVEVVVVASVARTFLPFFFLFLFFFLWP